MNDISQSILISEIRHCVGILKIGDVKGGTRRLSQLADNLQAAMAKNSELSSPEPKTDVVDVDWYPIAKRLFNVLGLKKSELRVITVQNAFINAEKAMHS